MKMNLNTEISREQVNYLIDEYRVYLAPSLALLGALALFIVVLIPQIFAFSSKKNTADSETQKLSQLQSAKNLAISEDVVELSSNLSLATEILPSTKDFQAAINDISTAAAESNVVIQSYQLQDTSVQTPLNSYPSLVFSVNIIANPSEAMGFIDNIYKKAPIAEVETVSGNDTSSSLLIAFYYKPFSPVNETTTEQIKKMNQAESTVLSQISSWDITTADVGNFISSESAQENGSPF